MNHDEQDDELWELLGKAPTRSASPAFVQNVLRAVRQAEPVPAPEIGFFAWLRQGWNALALAGAAAVVLFLSFNGQQPEGASRSAARSVVATDPMAIDRVVESDDFAVLNNLEVLIAFDDSNVWLDSSLP